MDYTITLMVGTRCSVRCKMATATDNLSSFPVWSQVRRSITSPGEHLHQSFPAIRSSESRHLSLSSECRLHCTWDPLFTSGGRASIYEYLVGLFPRLGDATHGGSGVLSVWAMHVVLSMQRSMATICSHPSPCSPNRLKAPESRNCISCQCFSTQTPGDLVKSQILTLEVRGGPKILHF